MYVEDMKTSISHIKGQSRIFNMSGGIFFLYFSFENLCADIHSRNMEYCVFHICKTGINLMTISMEFSVA